MLTFRQFIAESITDTPEFKRWFGDSKVVDAQGNPLVVHHGTKSTFEAFTALPDSHLGFHFGNEDQAGKAMRAKKGSDVMSVYLHISNPLRTIDAGDWSNPYRAWEVLNKATKGALGDLTMDMISNTPRQSRLAILMDKLKSLGYDGIVYKNRIEGKGDSYIVLSPSQIKSIYNTGQFDPTNPNISEGLV